MTRPARKLPPWLDAALDVLALLRAEPKVPLERHLSGAVRTRGLGSHDRRLAGDAVFAWARRRASIDARMPKQARASRESRPRDRDLIALLVAASETDLALDSAWSAVGHDVAAEVAEVLARPAAASFPAWLAARVDDAALLAALALPATPVLAVNTSQRSVDDVIAALGGNAVRSPHVPDAVRLLKRTPIPRELTHDVWPMDDGSQAVALAALPPPGEAVLDVCAGGGGKTRLLLSRGAHVVAADLSRPRLVRGVRERAACVVADGTRAPFRAGAFARVLVDAPCSGTGTLRRHPDLAHRIDPADLPQLARVQRDLVRAGLALVRPGDVLVYATCSILRDENEAVIDEMLGLPGVSPQPLDALWAGRVLGVGAPGAARARMLPHTHGTDGFFIAALRVD